MKDKLAKKAAKRDLPAGDDGEIEISSLPSAKSPKQAKFMLNGATNGQTEVVSVEKLPAGKTSATVGKSLFQHFTELTSEEEEKRMKAALQLLQQLSETKQPEKRKKELAYTLKRLVRGCGAATNISRAGFYTGLVALLITFDEQDITLEHIFDTMEKELHVGTTVANKDDADAVVGKILVCGAVQQASRLQNVDNDEHLERIANTLLQATKHRSYHASLAYALLIEIMEKLSAKQFNTVVWPLLQTELRRSWPKQTLQTVHCLIAVQRLFPNTVNAKFLKSHFGSADLLQPESYAHLYRLFWEHGNMQFLTHPGFEHFGVYISKSENLSSFWTQQVDAGLETSNKLRELITLKIATDIFTSWQQLQEAEKKRVVVADLLSPNFMHLLVEGLKNQKQKKDETLKAFYDDFFEALVSCCTHLGDDKELVAVIRRLILSPGLFEIEKYTSTRIVHQIISALGATGIKEIYKLYRIIFLGTQPKNISNASETWLNFERMNAGYMLQHLLAHKAVRQEYNWREQQLRFLLTCGIFHVSETVEICKKETASPFSKDFGEQCKNMFFTSLQSRLVDLQQEKQLLLKLVQYCNERIEQKHAAKHFRIKQYDELLHKYWQQMFLAVGGNVVSGKKHASAKGTAGGDKLELIFQILLLNMGLQLFREPEMAGPAIEDLLKCMQRVKEKHRNKQKGKEVVKKANAEVEEPEWIEVVVDLFLHLLSQNATALRNIVNALFPHLCGSLNLTAVHQILAVLDMKDGHNPLSAQGEESDAENDTEDEDEETATKSAIGKADSDSEVDENDNDEEDDDEDDDDDDDDDDEEIEAEDADATAADKLRNAVSQALMEHGGVPTAGDDDDDMASIDLNDMTEEQGRKLDEALAEAFKAMRKTGGGGSAVKKSKSYRIKVTTVMHFRIRVLDLLEIYLQQQPPLLITIEIMLALFNMLPYCVGDELKPLQIKVEKVLQKLTALKCDVADVQEDEVVAFIRLIVEQKSPASAFETMNKLRNKCIIFLVNGANKIAAEKGADSKKVLALCQEYIQEFLQSRNPSVNITLLSDIFRLRWCGVWDLAVALSREGLTMQTRAFRRIQIYEILDVLYKNHYLQRLDVSITKKQLKVIESSLCSHIKALAAKTDTEVSPKEYSVLIQLLFQAQKCHQRLQLKSVLADIEIGQAVQRMRADKTQLYQRFCAAYKLPVVRNKGKQKANSKQHTEETANDQKEQGVNEGREATDAMENGADNETQKKRKKSNDKALRKLKKQKKEQRLQIASAGLNGGFAFARQTSHEENSSAEEET